MAYGVSLNRSAQPADHVPYAVSHTQVWRPLVIARFPHGTEKPSVPLLPSGSDGVRDALLRGT